jgi:hypothetical protein
MFVSVLVYSGTAILYVDLTDTFYSLKKTLIIDTCGMVGARYHPSIHPFIHQSNQKSQYRRVLPHMLYFYRQWKFHQNLRNLRVHFHVHNSTALVLTWAKPFYAIIVTRNLILSFHLRLDLLSELYMITTKKPARMSVLYYVCYASSAAHSPSKFSPSYHIPRYKTRSSLWC